ncbi:MAG TPA: AP2 domain-containing protein [Clostridiales bacterium]|nr:AP2 domain-containing protein [Clostridiales bacterium]
MTNHEKYGMLTVLREFQNEKGYRVCECLCECGNGKVVYKSNLVHGRTKSCGCLEEANRRKFNDLSGKRFGKLVAVSPTDKRKKGNIVWECKCDCGNTAFVVGRYLTRGFTKSCGCYLKEKTDITNEQFGELTALYPDDKSTQGAQKWICRCNCGNISSVAISNLRNGHTKSCGCLGELEYRTLIDGTCLEQIASKTIPKDNRSGVKGVSYYSQSASWVATLTFKGKHYYLGKYKSVLEAAKARWHAEEQLVTPFIEEHAHLLSEK